MCRDAPAGIPQPVIGAFRGEAAIADGWLQRAQYLLQGWNLVTKVLQTGPPVARAATPTRTHRPLLRLLPTPGRHGAEVIDTSAAVNAVLVRLDADIQPIVEEVLADMIRDVRTARVFSLDELEAGRADLIIVSDGPGHAVTSLLNALHASPDTAGVPLTVLSTQASLEDIEGLPGNVSSVLRMPFELEDLVNAIRYALVQVNSNVELIVRGPQDG